MLFTLSWCSSTVGASLLAKVKDDSGCFMDRRNALETFASRLAPTEVALAYLNLIGVRLTGSGDVLFGGPVFVPLAEQAVLVLGVVALGNALDMYRLDNGRYPTTEQGFEALIQQPANMADARNYRTGG